MAQNNRPDGELHRNSTLVQTSDTTTTATPPAVVKPPQGSDEHSDPSSIGKTDISHLVDQAAQCCLGQAVQRVTSYNIVFHRCILNRLESHVGHKTISGSWKERKSKLHICILEIEAVLRATRHWAEDLRNHTVMVQSDNSATVT